MTTTRKAIFVATALAAFAVCAIVLVSPEAFAAVLPHANGHDILSTVIANAPVLVGAGSLNALRETRAKVVTDMRAILSAAETDGNRELTAEEITAYDGLEAQLDPLKARIDRAQRLAGEEASLVEVRPAAARAIGVQPVRAAGPEAVREFESLGQFMHAVRFNPNDQRLHFVEGSGEPTDFSAEQRMDNGPSGGFAIPPQFRPVIMSVPPQDALVRPRASVFEAGDPPDAPMTMGALDQTGTNPGNMFGGMNFNWINEGDTKPDTGANLRQVTLTPHEIAGTVTATDKLLRNWVSASAFFEKQMRGGVTAAEDYAFLRGTGVNQPLGVINAGATYWVHRANANQVGYADLVAMEARMLMRGGNPVWSIPQSCLAQLRTMTDPEGHYIWKSNAAVDAAATGFVGTLLGYPVRWNNRAPLLGTKGDIVFADWSYYLIKDGSGPFVAASEHVYFQQNKTMIKIFWNVDGSPWLTAPIAEENGYQVSPFVGLDVP
jgi:HK97 family phage major capsid protein